MTRRAALLPLLLLTVLAASCEKATTGGPPMRQVSASEFGKLRWLVGAWRGVGIHGGDEVGAPFYESWRAVDDSTLVMHRFGDSAMTRARDSARIELRGGTVYYRSEKPLMMLVGIASRGADFFPEGKSRGGITYSTQFACADTLAPATVPCRMRPDTLTMNSRFWWSALWQTAPLLLGHDLGEGEHLVYNPVWRPQAARR